MELKCIVKIKEEHNPPTFKKSLGKGVIAVESAIFKTIPVEQIESPIIQMRIQEIKQELLEKYFDVSFEIIKEEN